MIHIPGKPVKPPVELTNSTAKKQIDNAFKNQAGDKCTNYKKIYDRLKAISLHKTKASDSESGKCYFCESKIERGSKLQVEHFRPKSGVSKKDTNGEVNKGYYWLANEWTNLLLACSVCNGAGAKGNRFPIAGIRATPFNPVKNDKLYRKNCIAKNSPLVDERPILLNPEIDVPEEFLTFEIDGYMKEVPDTLNRGKITIEVMQLNRGVLVGDRQKILNDYSNSINILYVGFMSGFLDKSGLDYLLKIECKKIKSGSMPEMEFSAWGKHINKNFENIIADNFPDAFRLKLIDIFNNI